MDNKEIIKQKEVQSKADAERQKVVDIVNEIRHNAQVLEGKALVEYLAKIHPSDAYDLIHHEVPQKHMQEIKNDPKLALTMKEITKRATESWNHDHSSATMFDVDKACSRVYGILLKMIAELNKSQVQMQEEITILKGANADKPKGAHNKVTHLQDVGKDDPK